MARTGFELAPYPVLAPIEQAPLAERKATLRTRALSPEGLCRDDATFTRADIRKTLARCGMDLGFTRQQLTQLAAELDQDLVVVRQASHPDHEYLTTKGLLNRERYIATTADAKATATVPAPDPPVVDAALRASTVPLDAEQRATVRAACAPNAWANIEGLAGTGKTTALSAAVAAYRAAGDGGAPTADQVIVVCVAAATAERTGRKLGADRWYLVEGFRQAVAKGALSPTERSLVLVDEACMVNTFQEADLLRAAGDAQIVNLGDPGQLTPIGAGGWYGPQAERHHPVRLRTVHRHKDPDDTADYTRLHDGQARAAVQGLSRRGRVQIQDNPEDRIGTAVGDYARWRNQGRTATEVLTVIDGANRQLDTVNRLLQQDRLRRGELGAESLEVTATDQGRTWRLHVGDQVLFLDPYRQPRLSVRNGAAGEVTGLDAERRHVRIRLADQDREVTVRLAEQDHRQPLGLAYAVHAAKFQGGEIDVVQALPGSARVTNANAGYSQLTRAEVAHVYLDRRTQGTDPLAGIAQAWSRPAPTLSVLHRLHADRQRLATRTAGARAKQAPATPTQRARRLRAQAPPTPRLTSRTRAGATPPASPSGSGHARASSRLTVLR